MLQSYKCLMHCSMRKRCVCVLKLSLLSGKFGGKPMVGTPSVIYHLVYHLPHLHQYQHQHLLHHYQHQPSLLHHLYHHQQYPLMMLKLGWPGAHDHLHSCTKTKCITYCSTNGSNSKSTSSRSIFKQWCTTNRTTCCQPPR